MFGAIFARRPGRARAIARVAVVAVLGSMFTAGVALSAPARAAEQAVAQNVAPPPTAPLPLVARPNRGLPAGVTAAVEPPRIKASGAPVSPAAAKALDADQGVQRASVAKAAVGPLAVQEADPNTLRLRSGFLLGTTSLAVYFSEGVVGDTSWTSWYGTAVDEQSGQEQRSITLTRAQTGKCGIPLTFCQQLGATDGWNLISGREYRVKLTMIFADGRQIETLVSNVASARAYTEPPTVPDAQAAGCSCPNVFTRAPGLQALRGNLVNTATGAMVRTETDLVMQSFGLPFQAARIYSSRNPQPGMFGPGWSWTYDARVISSVGPDVRIQAEDGSQVVFNANGQGGFDRAPGVDSRLSRSGTGWLLHTADQRDLLFNAAGALLSVKNARGDGVTLAYSAAGALTSLKDAAGRTVQVATDSAKQITKLTLPDGRSVAYGYGTDGRLTSVRDASLFTWAYGYNAAGQLATVTDPLGRAEVTVGYTGARVTSQTDALGNVIRFAWDAGTQQATTTDADGVKVIDAYRGNVLLSTTTVDPDPDNSNTVLNRYDGRLHRNLTVDAEANQTQVDHDDDGNVVRSRAADPYAYTESNTYDTRNNLLQHTDRRGETWTYTWNAQNELTGQTEPRKANGYRYTYDARGLVLTRTDPMGHRTSYEYDSAGNRTAEVSATGRRTEFQYDSVGRRTGVTDPRGTGADKLLTGPLHTIRTGYDAEDRPIRVYEPGNLLPSEWTYNAAGELVAAADPLKRTSRTQYDRAGRVSATVDPAGNTTRYAYTGAGRRLSITDALGNVLSWTYDVQGRVATETTPRGNQAGGAAAAPFVTTFRYDHRGNRISSTRPAPGGGTAEVRTVFDSLGRPTTQTDQLQHTTELRYDGNGNITDLFDENRHSLRYLYDGAGRRTGAEEDGNAAAAAKIEYNDIGDPIQQTLPTGGIVKWNYDDDGRTVGIVEPRGNVAGATAANYTTAYSYDRAGNLATVKDPLGATTSYDYDAQDRVTKLTDASGAITRYAYDDADQVFAVAGPVQGAVADTLSQLFLAKVNLISGKGPVNGTILTLTGLDAPVTFALGQITGVPMTRYGYDLNGNAVVTSDQLGRVNRTLYDKLNRPSASADPLGRARAYGYDADSNLTTMQTASNVPGLALTDTDRDRRTITSSYDGLNRLSRRQVGPGGPLYTYGYDSNSRLTSTTDPGGSSVFGYDDTGLMTSAARNGRTFGYAYDDDDNVSRRTYPDGTRIDYAYDDGNRMTDLTTTRGGSSQRYGFAYDVSDHLTRTTFPASTGGQETRSYDRAGRLSEIAASTGAGVETGYAVTRDLVGNPTRIDTTRRDSATTPRQQETISYSYDASQRLTAACYGSTTCGNILLDRSAERYDYAYDLVGNRTSQTHSVGSDLTKKSVTAYTYDLADQLLAKTTIGAGAGVTTYGYDGEGNQTKAGSDQFSYNLDHTLATATTGGQTTNFGYDAFGDRVSGTGGSVATTRNYDWDVNSSMPMLAVESGAGALGGRSYAYGPDGAQLALYTGSGASGHPYLHDWLGGTAAVVAADGTGEWSYNYDPFGSARGNGGPTAGRKLSATAPDNPLQFAGGYNDGESGGQSGNYHLGARDYDTDTGRFTGTDPVSRDVGSPAASSYSYVDGRSTFAIDPSGMLPSPDTLDAINRVRQQQGKSLLMYGPNDTLVEYNPSNTASDDIDPDPLAAQRSAAQQAVSEAESFTKQLGDEIISLVMDLIGVTDAVNCIRNGDIGACLSTVLTAVPWGKMFKAAKVLIKAVGLGRRLVDGFKRLNAARLALERVTTAAREAIVAAKEQRRIAKAEEAAAKAEARQARAEAQAARRNLERSRVEQAEARKAKDEVTQVKDRRTSGCQRQVAQSFTSTARVVLADGSSKPIAQVRAGDQVLSSPQEGLAQGPDQAAPESRPVTVRITSHAPKQLVDLQLVGAGSGGGGPPSTLTVTSGHPMFVAGKGWVGADQVKAGDDLVDPGGRAVEIVKATKRQATVSVYNFTVADRHTYYVKTGTSAAVLVHNSSIEIMQDVVSAPAVGESCQLLRTSPKQLQSKFKHASDFGVSGNYNGEKASEFRSAVQQHINAPGTQQIQGTYRGQAVTHHLDPTSGLNVISENGEFVSGWRLNPVQLGHVLQHGGLGGG